MTKTAAKKLFDKTGEYSKTLGDCYWLGRPTSEIVLPPHT